MTEPTRAEVFDQLRRVIAWEMDAQAGMQRAVEEMPPLIADTVLDYFDITLSLVPTCPTSSETHGHAADR